MGSEFSMVMGRRLFHPLPLHFLFPFPRAPAEEEEAKTPIIRIRENRERDGGGRPYAQQSREAVAHPPTDRPATTPFPPSDAAARAVAKNYACMWGGGAQSIDNVP